MFNILNHRKNANQNNKFHLNPVIMAVIKKTANAGKGAGKKIS
jgi:hypothetical protein